MGKKKIFIAQKSVIEWRPNWELIKLRIILLGWVCCYFVTVALAMSIMFFSLTLFFTVQIDPDLDIKELSLRITIVVSILVFITFGAMLFGCWKDKEKIIQVTSRSKQLSPFSVYFYYPSKLLCGLIKKIPSICTKT